MGNHKEVVMVRVHLRLLMVHHQLVVLSLVGMASRVDTDRMVLAMRVVMVELAEMADMDEEVFLEIKVSSMIVRKYMKSYKWTFYIYTLCICYIHRDYMIPSNELNIEAGVLYRYTCP